VSDRGKVSRQNSEQRNYAEREDAEVKVKPKFVGLCPGDVAQDGVAAGLHHNAYDQKTEKSK